MALAFITGGTSGIGYAFAKYFAEKGYDLILTGKKEDEPPVSVYELRSRYKIFVELLYADFRIESDIKMVERYLKNISVDILINSAGYGSGKLFIESDQGDMEDLIKVHLIAPLRFIHTVLPKMIGENKGIIIYISSLSAFIPIPRDPVYTACKSFTNSFLESLHISLSGTAIKLQVLCPGFVHTNFHNRPGLSSKDMRKRSLMKWMEPEVVVRISVRNINQRNKVIVVPGMMNKVALALYNLLPRIIYYRIASRYFI